MGFPNSWTCKNCKSKNTNARKCYRCGFQYPLHYPDIWNCPDCSKIVSNSKKCVCGYPKNLKYPELWHCPHCQKLIKNRKICPYCISKGKDAKMGNKISKRTILFTAFLFILLIISLYNSNHKTANSAGFVQYNLSNASLTLPDWNIVNQTSRSVKLYDSESLQSIYYFKNEPYFSSLTNEVYHVYNILEQDFDMNITDEYSYNSWSVLCFSSNLFNSCVGAANCTNEIFYLQFTNYGSDLNSSFYKSLISSFCCNC